MDEWMDGWTEWQQRDRDKSIYDSMNEEDTEACTMG